MRQRPRRHVRADPVHKPLQLRVTEDLRRAGIVRMDSQSAEHSSGIPFPALWVRRRERLQDRGYKVPCDLAALNLLTK